MSEKSITLRSTSEIWNWDAADSRAMPLDTTPTAPSDCPRPPSDVHLTTEQRRHGIPLEADEGEHRAITILSLIAPSLA